MPCYPLANFEWFLFVNACYSPANFEYHPFPQLCPANFEYHPFDFWKLFHFYSTLPMHLPHPLTLTHTSRYKTVILRARRLQCKVRTPKLPPRKSTVFLTSNEPYCILTGKWPCRGFYGKGNPFCAWEKAVLICSYMDAQRYITFEVKDGTYRVGDGTASAEKLKMSQMNARRLAVVIIQTLKHQRMTCVWMLEEGVWWDL